MNGQFWLWMGLLMITKSRLLGVLCACMLASPALADGVKQVTITDAGAVADGKTLCTDAIAKAIDEVAAAGGGVVEIPKGEYLTGPIRLKSNITLQVDEGAVVKFSTDPSLYPLVRTRYEAVDIMNYSPLIYAYQCENIKITGKGTLDGQGKTWWAWARSFGRKEANATKTTSMPAGGGSGQGVGGSSASRQLMLMYTNDRAGKYPLEQRVFGDQHPGFRPCFIEPYECKGVTIEGVTVRESPFWNLHPLYSENVVVRDVTVFGDGPNTDGCDPDSCKNVLIENCHFTTGDDCIAIKSGRDGDGLRVDRPSEDITIRNCTMMGGHGGITVGSETSGGVRKVLAEECTMDGPDFGIRIKSARGRGGVVEDITCRRITIKNVKKAAITLDLTYGTSKDARTDPNVMMVKTETTPVFKNIDIEDVTCENSKEAIKVIGLPESPIEGLTIKNVTLNGSRGASLSYVKGFVRENATVVAKSGTPWMMKEVAEVK